MRYVSNLLRVVLSHRQPWPNANRPMECSLSMKKSHTWRALSIDGYVHNVRDLELGSCVDRRRFTKMCRHAVLQKNVTWRIQFTQFFTIVVLIYILAYIIVSQCIDQSISYNAF